MNDPKKAAYNAVYSRTTVGVSDVMKSASSGNGHTSASYDAPAPVKRNIPTGHIMSAELSSWFSLLCLCFGIAPAACCSCWRCCCHPVGCRLFCHRSQVSEIVKERSENRFAHKKTTRAATRIAFVESLISCPAKSILIESESCFILP